MTDQKIITLDDIERMRGSGQLKALAFNKPYTIKVEDKKPLNDICENCHKNKVWHYNETVRKKGTENVKIMNICSPCFSKITGAK